MERQHLHDLVAVGRHCLQLHLQLVLVAGASVRGPGSNFVDGAVIGKSFADEAGLRDVRAVGARCSAR